MRNMLYKRLMAQMALRGMTNQALAKQIGMLYETLCRKMRGESCFTLDEAILIKAALTCTEPLETLFERSIPNDKEESAHGKKMPVVPPADC